MDDNSVIKAVSYFLPYFQKNTHPKAPWSIHLNFNWKHVSFELLETHVNEAGFPSSELFRKIETIDPGWMVSSRGEPRLLDLKTKRPLKTLSVDMFASIEERMQALENPREPTFFSVMDEVFGVSNE